MGDSAFDIRALLLATTLLLTASPAAAQQAPAAPAPQASATADADRAAARELGREGLQAFDNKDFTTAVERLGKAIALYDAPTLRLTRARALAALGRFVSAAEDYRAIGMKPPQAGEPPAFVAARQAAEKELPEIEAKIAYLTLQLAQEAVVTLDGAQLSPAAFGVPRPIDPGQHTIQVIAPGGQAQTQQLDVAPGEKKVLQLEVQAAPSPPPVAPSTVPTAPAMAPQPEADTQANQRSNIDPAYLWGGAAVASAVVSIITGVVALNKKSTFEDKNRPEVPHAEKEDARSSALTMAWISTAFTGVALVTGGVTAYLLVSPETGEPMQDRASVPAGASVSIAGRF